MGDVVVHLLTPNNQRLSAAQQRKPEARTSIAADKPCWTEPPVMRWCELFWLKGIRTKPPLASRDYDPERHGIDTKLASANWPMARSGVASVPLQTTTILRWGSPAPCVGAWACAGWRPSGAVPMQRPTAPSASLQTPTWCQYRGAVGHNLLMQVGVWFKSPLAKTTHTTASRAVQSNMVYLPRLTSSPQACAVARRINADC